MVGCWFKAPCHGLYRPQSTEITFCYEEYRERKPLLLDGSFGEYDLIVFYRPLQDQHQGLAGGLSIMPSRLLSDLRQEDLERPTIVMQQLFTKEGNQHGEKHKQSLFCNRCLSKNWIESENLPV